jgi:hypothetical protein
MRIGARQHQRAAADLGEGAGAADRPGERRVMLSLPTASVPGVDRSDPEYLFVPDSIGIPQVLARLKVPACPPLPPELAWSAMILETIWGCPAPGLEGDGAARARKEDAGAEARAIAAALDPAAGSDRVAIDGERAAEASGCYPTARRSRHPYRHLRHGCADAAAEAALPAGTAASRCRASRNPG